MTISSTNRLVVFQGNGAASTFPFNFVAFEQTDMLLIQLVVATGQLTVLAQTTNYTVSLNADQDTSPGGSVTLVAGPLPTGTSLVVTTAMPEMQGVNLANAGAFLPSVINNALDQLVIMVQQLQQQLTLAITAPLTDEGANLGLPPAAQRAGMTLQFDANGNVALAAPAPGGTTPGPQIASGAVNGVNQSFTFIAASGTMPVPLVFAGGVFQYPVTDYDLPVPAGANLWQIVFTYAPTNGPIAVVILS